MPTVASLNAVITADVSGFNKGVSSAESRLDGFSSAIKGIRGHVDSIGSQFNAVGAGIAAIAGGVVASVGKLGFGFNAMKEQATIAFTTMLGSGEVAKSFLDELAQFATRTPFEFPDLTRAAQKFMAMGFSASQVIPILTSVGDAVAGMGGGAAEIERVTRALVQMQAKGKVSAEEMMQLAEAGIPAWQILAEKIGISIPEAMKRSEKGAIDAKTAIDALLKGMDERFGGMMEQQSRTFQGVLSTIKDAGTQILGDVLLPLFERVRDGLLSVADILPRLQQYFAGLSPEVKNAAIAIAAVIGVAPVLTFAISAMATAVAALLSPIGLAVIAVGALATAIAGNWGGLRDKIKDIIGEIVKLYQQHSSEINSLVDIAKRVLGTLGDVIKTNLGEAFNIIRAGLKILNGDWRGAWDVIVEIGKNRINLIVSIVRNMWDNLKAVFGFIKDGLVSLWSQGVDAARAGAQAIVDAAVSAFNNLPSILDTILNRIPTLVGYVFGIIMGMVVSEGKRIVEQVGTWLIDLIATAQNYLNSLVDTAAQYVTSWASALIDGAGGGVTGFVTVLIKLPGAVVDVFSSIFSFLASLPAKIFKMGLAIGGNLLRGFMSGFSVGKSGGGAEALGDVGSSLFGGLKDKIAGVVEDIKNSIAPKANVAGAAVGKALGGGLGKGGGKAIKDAFIGLDKEMEAALQDWVRSQDTEIKLTSKLWNSLPPDIRAAAKAISRILKEEEEQRSRDLFIALVNQQKDYKDAYKAIERESAAFAGMNAVIIDDGIKRILGITRTGLGDFVKIHQETIGGVLKIYRDSYNAPIKSLAQQAVDDLVEEIKKGQEQTASAWGKLFEKAAEQMNKIKGTLGDGMAEIVAGVLGGWGKMSAGTLEALGEWSGKITNVINHIPDALGGSAIRKILGDINEWASFLDSILQLFDYSLGELVALIADKLKGVFGNVFSDILGSLKSFGSQLLEGFKSIFSGLGGQLAGIIGGLGAIFGGSKVGGVKGGLLGGGGGALSGFLLGNMIVPGIGGLIGGIGGGIAGFLGGLFGGPSKEEKEAMERAKEETALNLEQTRTAIQGTIADNMSKFLEIADKLHAFAEVPRKAIRRAVAQYRLLMTELVNATKDIKTEAAQHAKEIAENMGPAFGLLLSSLQIGKELKDAEFATDEQIAALMAFTDKVQAGFITVAEAIDVKVAKQAAKVANKLSDVFSFVGSIPATIKAIIETPTVTDAEFEAALTVQFGFAGRIIDRAVEMAEEVKRYALSKTVKVTEQLKSIADNLSGVFGFGKMLSEYKPLEDALQGIVSADLTKLVSWLDGWIEQSMGVLNRSLTLEDIWLQIKNSLQSTLSTVSSMAGGAGGSMAGLQIASAPSLTLAPSSLALAPKSNGSTSTSNTTVDNRVIINGNVVFDDPKKNEDLRRLLSSGGLPLQVSMNG